MLTERPGHIELATNKTVQETQLSLTNRATHLCKRNGVADLLKLAPSHMCYHSEFGSSALTDVGHTLF